MKDKVLLHFLPELHQKMFLFRRQLRLFLDRLRVK